MNDGNNMLIQIEISEAQREHIEENDNQSAEKELACLRSTNNIDYSRNNESEVKVKF